MWVAMRPGHGTDTPIPESGHGCLGHGVDRCPAGHVAPHADDLCAAVGERAGRSVERRLLDVGEDDIHALRGEALGERPPDAARSAGDDRHLAGQ